MLPVSHLMHHGGGDSAAAVPVRGDAAVRRQVGRGLQRRECQLLHARAPQRVRTSGLSTHSPLRHVDSSFDLKRQHALSHDEFLTHVTC